MKIYKLAILFVICLAFVFSSCNKEPLTVYEGEWKLVNSIGGVHGGGVDVSWQSMKIEDTQFELFQDGDVILRADLTFNGIALGDDSETVLFDFTFDQETSDLKIINEFSTKYLRFNESEHLIVHDGCCDLYGFVFEKN